MAQRRLFGLAFFLILIFLSSCKKPQKPNLLPVKPELNIQDAFQIRTTKETTMKFYLYINKTTTNVVSVDYNLVDGTAISPKDFESASGTISIPAHQTQTTLDVKIKGNPLNLRQPNILFTVQFSNPKNCKLVKNKAEGTIITENGTYLPTDNEGYFTPLNYPGYILVWHDEFSANSLNPNYWNKEIGNNNGWGNKELEYYTGSPKNIFLSNGNLIIEARKENTSTFHYTSGRITTQNKKHFKYGRIDIRAKLPVDKGMWPALWMLGSNISSVGWPACGETDIMELIGTYPSRISGTMHWESASGSDVHKGANYNLSYGDFSQKFHVFSIVWSKDTIKWYVDNQLYLTNTITDVGADEYPFNANQFLIFNVAVGGNWPGSPDGTTRFPQRMFVDYVRVFQLSKH